MIDRATVIAVIVACLVGTVRRCAAQHAVMALREMTIDGATEDLSPVRGIAVSSAGTIAVMQPVDHQILFFSPTGKRLGAFGRAGEGPGEFGSMQAVLGWRADTLWVSELMRQRTTFITPDFKLARTLAGPEVMYAAPGVARERSGYGTIGIRGIFANGDLLAMIFAEHRTAYPVWLPAAARQHGNLLVRTTSGGTLQRFLAAMPAASRDCEVWTGKSVVSIRWCRMPHISISPEDTRVTILIPAPNATSSYQLTSISGASGDTLFHRKYSFNPVPIPHDVIETTRTAGMADRSMSPAMREAYRSMKYPATYPPIARLVNGSDGTTWLEEYGNENKPHRWRLLDQRGVFLGVVQLPGNASLSVASLSSLWAVEVDADGVQSVTRYHTPNFQRTH